MGMFDYIKCQYPLPVKGNSTSGFQTKDTPAQMCDLYEIREDGLLWHEAYDIEDHSDPSKEGLEAFIGCMTPVNKRWEPEPFTGDIDFYDFKHDNYVGWIEYRATFVVGELTSILVVADRD